MKTGCNRESTFSESTNIQRVKADFSLVTELSLRDNYRATKALLRVADRHMHPPSPTITHRSTEVRPAPSLADGLPPESHHAENSTAEAHWIATCIESIPGTNHLGRIGILTRTHKRSEAVSRAITQLGIDHLTVEQFDFFRRQEIKDLLARLRLLLNPADSGSLQRLTQRPSSGIGPATLRTLWLEGQQCGLKITDLAQRRTHQHGDPFHTLHQALAHGTVVVFDVETTGLSSTEDEVIDLGAVKLVAGRQVDTFDALLRPTRPLGDSAAIHGISEETLHSHGRDPADVFREFARFAEEAVLVGHNVSFDLSMIRAHAGRLGITLQTDLWDDTLDIARRFLNLERHDLTTVSRHFRYKEPRHSCRVANGMRKNRAKLLTFLPPLARRTRVSTLRQSTSRSRPSGNGDREMNSNSKPHPLNFSIYPVPFPISISRI